MSKTNQGFRDLMAYQKAFLQACEIFDNTLKFPKEEKYSLTDQIRRSSRSVCVNLAEANRKGEYYKYFFSLHCHYVAEDECERLIELNEEVGRLLSYMVNHPDKFGVSPIN